MKENLTVAQAVFLAQRAERLFHQAASAWVVGNNSGDPAVFRRQENQCDKYRAQAEGLLAPLKIKVDYPGLYPSFKVNGSEEHSVLNAISAALDCKTAKERAEMNAQREELREAAEIAHRIFSGHSGKPGDAITGIEFEQRARALDRLRAALERCQGKQAV